MASNKPGTPKGTRDFSTQEMAKRNFIFNTITAVFKKYGYQEIQTPAMENLETLTGKYGDEGDKLIFKILNTNEQLEILKATSIKNVVFQEGTPTWDIHIERQIEDLRRKALLKSSEKALRYDLTVPFARYVVMHQNEITFPFKRYQVQPVWRADRPQRGRYREFYQCDADVVGSDSLLNEAEFILIYQEALHRLGLTDFTIKLNNRKILSGIAEMIGKPELIIDMTVAIDKLDKIGLDGVMKELLDRGFSQHDLETLQPVILLEGTTVEKLERLKQVLSASATGLKGIKEVETIFSYLDLLNPEFQLSTLNSQIQFDITLARGLNYYTGAIFEVKSNQVAMGSIGGGGRYDDLTGMFGLKGLTGVGISFGADRIYDVLAELDLFPHSTGHTTQVLISNFDAQAERYALPLLQRLRSKGIAAEIYPSPAKLKKQLAYADSKRIPYVVLIGSQEMDTGLLSLKNMQSGAQQQLSVEDMMHVLDQSPE